MGTPQIIYLSLAFASLLLAANNHGKPKKGNENFWISLIATLIVITLLSWGGFFK